MQTDKHTQMGRYELSLLLSSTYKMEVKIMIINKMVEINIEPVEKMFADTLKEYIEDKELVYDLYKQFKDSHIDMTIGNQFVNYLQNACINNVLEDEYIIYRILGYDCLEAAFYTDYILELMHSVVDIEEISVEEYQQIMDDIKENWADK